LAQARRARKLAVQQRDELALGGQAPHPGVGPVLLDQPIESGPRDMLQKPVKNRILMPHGIDLPSCPEPSPNVPNRVESMPCALSAKNEPDSRDGQARPRGYLVVNWIREAAAAVSSARGQRRGRRA